MCFGGFPKTIAFDETNVLRTLLNDTHSCLHWATYFRRMLGSRCTGYPLTDSAVWNLYEHIPEVPISDNPYLGH